MQHARTAMSWLLAMVLVAIAAYWPGLHGGFLFDDFANLPALGSTGAVDNWATFWRYITSGTADPTGRPLVLLTFLLDAQNWPADPYPFKRTSLVLHLINGVLLYALLSRLGALLKVETPRYRAAALFGATMWLLHPLLVSTTLYVVQREAMLPATCVLIGLQLWLHGRTQWATGRKRTGLIWSLAGLGGFSVLGTLSKGNGALLPIYALLIEFVLLTPRRSFDDGVTPRTYRAFQCIFIFLPAIAICSYLMWTGVHGILAGGPALRPWTYGQRMLTEPRVLMDYLTLLWLPRPFSSGLFNDQYVVATGLLQPLTTLPAIIAVTTMVAAALRLRRSCPALALAVLFYFAGQLIESTSIPLELYFEHRNYVPALLMFWPLGLWLADIRTLPLIKRCLMIVLPLGLGLMTHARAEVWGDMQEQALIWAKINPYSARAQTYAAQVEMQTGHPQDAVHRLANLLAMQPDQAQLAFNLIDARCMADGVSRGDIDAAKVAMQSTSDGGMIFTTWFDHVLPVALADECPGLAVEDLLDMVRIGLQNPKLRTPARQQDLTYIRGHIELAQRRPDAAFSDFSRALDLQVRPNVALQGAATLGAAGYPKFGLGLLDHYQKVQGRDEAKPSGISMATVHWWVLEKQGYWPRELAHLRRQLILDARHMDENSPSSSFPQDKPH
jgi:protein O-mannosyl-transferase